jgi:hypothetical protein
MTPNTKPTAKSATTSKTSSISSPELWDKALQELKECVKSGACKPTAIEIHWTPEELKAMTPDDARPKRRMKTTRPAVNQTGTPRRRE